MRDFQPSDDFVVRVMRSIYEYEKNWQTERLSFLHKFAFSEFFQYALTTGGILLGLWNLARFYFAVLAPLVCW